MLERFAKRALDEANNEDGSGAGGGEDTSRGGDAGSRGRGGHRGGGAAGRGRGRGRGGGASGASDRNTDQDPPASKKAKVESAAGGGEA